MYNDYMYAIDRSDEYLEHYGIRGMKWGVRKAIERGGTGVGNRRLARQYFKAQKKLAKLEKRANSGAKYARRAAVLGAGAAAAGGLAALGTGGVARGIGRAGNLAMKASKPVGQAMQTVGSGLKKVGINNHLVVAGKRLERHGGDVGGKLFNKFAGASKAVNDWGNSHSVGANIAGKLNTAQKNHILASYGGAKMSPARERDFMERMKSSNAVTNKLNGMSNNTVARVGAGALAAGLAGAAGYNAYRAATTKKAAQKAADFRKEMNKTFAGTAYGKQGGSKKRRRR